MSKYSNNAIIIDTSHWTSSIDWATIKAGGVSAVWAKCSEGCDSIDDKFSNTVQGGYDNDIPVLAYHFFDPAYLKDSAFGEEHWPPFNTDPNDFTDPNQDKQLLNLKRALNHKKIYAIAIDVERWWIDYADYYKNKGAAGKMTSVWISTLFERFADAVRKTWPALEVYIYSRKSFWDEYCPQPLQVGWFANGQWPIWTAQYPTLTTQGAISWDQLRGIVLPQLDSAKVLSWGSMWDVWQFSGDNLILPGIHEALDLSIYKGTQDDLYTRIGFTPRNVAPIPTPAPTPTPAPAPVPDPVTPVPVTPMPANIDLSGVTVKLDEILTILHNHNL